MRPQMAACCAACSTASCAMRSALWTSAIASCRSFSSATQVSGFRHRLPGNSQASVTSSEGSAVSHLLGCLSCRLAAPSGPVTHGAP